ncbi:MAG: hypothetical protein ABMA25_15980 [Ilumatobacteraceae bacterium]
MSLSRISRPRRLLATALLGAALITAAPATGFAKEIGSGGAPAGGGAAACSPISSLVVKADARAGETGLATIDVSYGVKPCTNGQAVTANVSVGEYLNPAVVVYDNPGAPLNGKFTVAGVRVRVTYKVTVTVIDSATGAVAGTQSAFVAAIPKGV